MLTAPVDSVHKFLLTLGRAVQRASIYPPGHPAASLGLRPLVESLAELIADGPVSIAVGKTRLLASGAGLPPVEHRAGWLAARLFERQVAVITFAPELDAVDLDHLVSWLARPDGGSWPECAGLRLARFDGTKLRFQDHTDDMVDTPDAEKAWWALTAALRQSYGISADLAQDPEGLGNEIRRALEATEGMGISRLCEELVNLHAGLSLHDAESRSSALLKLAVLVEHLAPEVRGTLFRITPEDSPEKLALVEDLLPLLSEPPLIDIALQIEARHTERRGPFQYFFRKLAEVAIDHPVVQEALDRRLQEVGLPASLFEAEVDDDPRGRAVAPDPVSDFVPAGYRARLEELAAGGAPRGIGTIARDAFEGPALDGHLARVAVHACRADPSPETTDAYLGQLAEILPREMARQGVDTMSAVAKLLFWLRSTGLTLSGEGLASAALLEEAFASPTCLSQTLDAIDAAPAGEALEAAEWVIAGGSRAVAAVMNALRSAPTPAIRLKLAAAVLTLDEAAFDEHVMPALSESPRLAEAFAHALSVVDPARAIVCAMTLASHPSLVVRRRAMVWLLSVPLGAGKARVVLPRALAEGDRATVTAALEFAERYPAVVVSEALIEYLSERADRRFGFAQAWAIRLVAAGDDPHGLLARELRSRGWRWRADDRAVSVTMAQTLERVGTDSARAAAALWRRSPARLLSVFTAPLVEDPSDI